MGSIVLVLEDQDGFPYSGAAGFNLMKWNPKEPNSLVSIGTDTVFFARPPYCLPYVEPGAWVIHMMGPPAANVPDPVAAEIHLEPGGWKSVPVRIIKW